MSFTFGFEQDLREKQRREILQYDRDIDERAFNIEKTAVRTMKDELKPPSDLDKKVSFEIAVSVDKIQKSLIDLVNNVEEYKDQLKKEGDIVSPSNAPEEEDEEEDEDKDRNIFPVNGRQNGPYTPQFYQNMDRPNGHVYGPERKLSQKENRLTFKRIPN